MSHRKPSRNMCRKIQASRLIAVVALTAALGACGSDSAKDERDAALARAAAAEAAAAQARVAAAEAAERAADAEAALSAAQEALRLATRVLSGDGDADSRRELGEVLQRTNEQLAAARKGLEEATDAGSRETVRALELTEAALAEVRKAVGVVELAVSGTVLAASAHTAVGAALSAVDAAQAQLDRANEAISDEDSAAGMALREAASALTTARVSLLPKVREELESAEAARDKARRDLRAALEGIGVDVADDASLDRLVELAKANLSDTDTYADLRAALKAINVEIADDATLEDVLAKLRETLTSLSADQAAANRAAGALRTALGSDDEATLEALVNTALMMLVPDPSRRDPSFGMNPEGTTGTATVAHTPRTRNYETRFYEGFSLVAGNGRSAWGNQTRYTFHAGEDAESYVPGDTEPDPVAYDPANPAMVIAYDSERRAFGGATDEFPARGTVLRGETNFAPPHDDAVQGVPRLRVQGVDWNNDPDAWGNYKHAWSGSFRYDGEAGLVMEFGGDGLIYGDLETLAAKGCPAGAANQQCNNPGTNNIEVSFGPPARDPWGEPAYYWNLSVPNPKRDLKRDEDGDPIVELFDENERPGSDSGYYRWYTGSPAAPGSYNRGGRYAYVQLEDGPPEDNPTAGVYEALLTSYAGTDDDDDARYLKYAAYGLFRYIDTNTTQVRPGRIQAFHYGLDAFDDGTLAYAAGRAAIPTTGDSIEASFSGRTMGWIMTRLADRANPGYASFVSEMIRVRGDISLHACIGGTGCGDAFVGALPEFKSAGANRIGGVIENMEYPIAPGAWSNRSNGQLERGDRFLRGKLFLGSSTGSNLTSSAAGGVAAETLAGAAITDKGAFEGEVIPDGREHRFATWTDDMARMTELFDTGAFEGVLYGPVSGMEAAGTWYAPMKAGRGNDVQPGGMGIVGSFGAVCETGCE